MVLELELLVMVLVLNGVEVDVVVVSHALHQAAVGALSHRARARVADGGEQLDVAVIVVVVVVVVMMMMIIRGVFFNHGR